MRLANDHPRRAVMLLPFVPALPLSLLVVSGSKMSACQPADSLRGPFSAPCWPMRRDFSRLTEPHAGLGVVTHVQWSPDGAYLLTGGSHESFRLWETQRWTSQAWATHVSTRHPVQSHPCLSHHLTLPDMGKGRSRA